MLENETKNERLLRELNSLESALASNSTENAFATSFKPKPIALSFFEFVAQIPIDPNPERRTIEPSWQIDRWPASRIGGDEAHGLSSELKQRLKQAKICCSAPDSPIVAVLGLLNAGKSSLVSTYLSDENRHRILVGSANKAGTHRFVLWLPESWSKEPEVWDFIGSRLQSIFGCESEPLSMDPAKAAMQYNDMVPRSYLDSNGQTKYRPTIEIPLIATDSELDRWGIAIMDCPDVQTGFLPQNTSSSSDISATATAPVTESMAPTASNELFHEHSQSIADARLNVLALAAPLCSAFVVVLPANAMHDQTVSRLMRLLQNRMPNVPQILAVNRVPRKYESDDIRTEINRLYRTQGFHRQYMAYGFDGPLQRERIPSSPSGYRPPRGQTLPLFFRIDESPAPQPPKPISDSDWLLNIGFQLDKQSLLKGVLDSTVQQLRARVREALAFAKAHSNKLKTVTKELQGTLANACLDFSLDGSAVAREPKIRLQASRQIILQISKSLERTAPWWAMPSRWTARIAEVSKAGLAKTTSWMPGWLNGAAWFSGKTESVGHWIRSRWTSGQSGKIVTADALVDYLKRHDQKGYLQLDDFLPDTPTRDSQQSRIQSACQRAIERFQNESHIELDDRELDEFTARMWSEMPLAKRLLTGLAPAGVLFAPLIAVIMVPVDFGGSAVLVFATIKELLLAGVAGVGLVIASADHMPKIAESEVAWQQLGDLYAVLCDELGLCRPNSEQMPPIRFGSGTRMIPSSKIAEATHAADPANKTIVPQEFSLNPRSIDFIESLLLRL